MNSSPSDGDVAAPWPWPGPVLAAADLKDGQSDRVISDAAALARDLRRPLCVIHVLEPLPDERLILSTIPNLREKRRDHARERLRWMTQDLAPEAEILLAEGRPWREILRAASGQGAALLVAGCGSGEGGIAAVLGGTAERLARQAVCPVLVLRGEQNLFGGTGPLLLCTDRSETSLAAFPLALALARLLSAPLLLACAEQPRALPGTREYERHDREIDAERRAEDEALANWRATHLPSDVEVRTRVVEGTPHRALCRLAQRERARLMIATSGPGWSKSFGGGTATRLARQAPCPVLAAPQTLLTGPLNRGKRARLGPRQSAQEKKAGIDLSAPVSSLMRSDFPAVKHHSSIAEALEHIRQVGIGERLVYFYVTGPGDRLLGVIPTRRLLTGPLEDKVETHMIQNVTVLRPEDSLLEASERFAKHKFLALPVVDDEGRLIGVLDVGLLSNKIFDLAEREQLEDLFETIGFNVAQVREASPFKAFRFRFPWLLATIASGTLCAILTSGFEVTLEKSIVLAFFMTLILGLGESVSIQSMTVAIQALRSVKPTLRWYLAALRREICAAMYLGAGCGAIVALIVWLWRGERWAAASIGSSIALALLTACVIGLSVPSALHALRLDPKIAAGPITLALTDVFTLLFYFTLAWFLL